MDYLLDTGILLIFLRRSSLLNEINQKYQPMSSQNTSMISVVSMGEIKSIAIRNQWATKRMDLLGQFFQQFLIADIHVESIIQRYAEIDAYSQGKLPGKPLLMSARNMGKNDLWIAATASVLEATLLTLDHDFNHLKNEFLEVETIDY